MIEGPTTGRRTHQVYRRASWLAAAVAAIAFLLAVPTTGQAKTFPVATTANTGAGSLRAAIEAANAAGGLDAIPIGVTGTINLETVLPSISDDLEIRGPGQNSLIVRRNAGSFRIFTVLSGSNVGISAMTVSGGRASQGAGIDSIGGILTVERVTVSGNEAVATGGAEAIAEGGGILSTGPLTLRESTVSGNSATASEGTSYAFAQGAGVAALDTAVIDSSTISDNVAGASFGNEVKARGAGVLLLGESTTIENSTVSGNSATAGVGSSQTVAEGGGIESSEILLSTSSTITGNSVQSSATTKGANMAAFGVTLIRDTIVSDPHGSQSCAKTVASGGFNIDDGLSCGLFQPTDLSATSPGISPNLAANGGPALTHALLPGSVAIDRGNAFGATTDQRGLARPSDFGAIPNPIGGDGSDIGAFEEQDMIAPKTTIERGPLPRSRRLVAKFEFSADEPGSTFQCRVDQQPFASCVSPFVRRVRRNRTHTFEVAAIDVAGNRGAPAQRKWRVKRKRRHHHHHHH